MSNSISSPAGSDTCRSIQGFIKKYRALKKPAHANAADHHDAISLKPYGEDMVLVNQVNKHNPSHVWTMFEEDGVLCVCAGLLQGDRIGFFVTEAPWRSGSEVFVDIGDHEPDEDWQ